MYLTDTEAAQVAAECVAAIDWQTKNITLNVDSDAIEAADMIAAITPMRPATLRLIEWMKNGLKYQAMKAVAPPGAAIGVTLMADTCRAIALNLADWGFHHEAEQILAALNRSDLAATGHYGRARLSKGTAMAAPDTPYRDVPVVAKALAYAIAFIDSLPADKQDASDRAAILAMLHAHAAVESKAARDGDAWGATAADILNYLADDVERRSGQRARLQ
jgi:hypothetical protein